MHQVKIESLSKLKYFYLFLPVSERFFLHSPVDFRERFCPDVGPDLTTGPPVFFGESLKSFFTFTLFPPLNLFIPFHTSTIFYKSDHPRIKFLSVLLIPNLIHQKLDLFFST